MLAGRCPNQSCAQRARNGGGRSGTSRRGSICSLSMKGRGLRLRAGHRLLLYAIALSLLVSGGSWAWANRLDQAGQAGASLRQLKTGLMKVHGLSAMVFVLLLGTLLPGHVRRAWHARKNRGNGAFFLTAVSVLTLSG